jgi:hypothetical protein
MLYDTAGNVTSLPLVLVNRSFFVDIPYFRTLGGAIGGTMAWTLINKASTVAKIKRIEINLGYDGSAPLFVDMIYALRRFQSAPSSSIANGAPVTVVNKSSLGKSSIVVFRSTSSTGITLTSRVDEVDFAQIGYPKNNNVTTHFVMESNSFNGNEVIELQALQGIGMFINVSGDAGQEFGGYIEWEEV